MKKILSTFALGATLLSTAANADFTRVEAGAGAWSYKPSGYASRTDNAGTLKLDGTYTSSEKASTGGYLWLFVKHPLPIVPNLRLEYVTFTDEGSVTGKVNGTAIPNNLAADTTIDIRQYDIVPYYNVLDNTFWMTVDLGVDVKIIQTDATIAPVTELGVQVYDGDSSSDQTIVPLLYLRDRVQIPFTGIGIEADAKAITDGTNTMYDVRAKVDYTLDFVPVVQPAIEVGYRMQKLRVDDGDTSQIDLQYSGLYMGIMARF